MDKNSQDDWFNKNPDEQEKQQFREAMLALFVERGMGDREEGTVYETTQDIIERLYDVQPAWKHATRQQKKTGSKRFKSHYGAVDSAYKKKDDTEAAIADLKRAKDTQTQAVNEKKNKMTPSAKTDITTISEGSAHSGRSTKRTKIGTRSATKGAKATPDISKIVEDIAVDWIKIHIKEVADKSLRKENAELKRQIAVLKQTNRYMRKKISNIKAECEFASGELDHAFGDGTLYPRISETPNVNEHRGSIMPMPQ